MGLSASSICRQPKNRLRCSALGSKQFVALDETRRRFLAISRYNRRNSAEGQIAPATANIDHQPPR